MTRAELRSVMDPLCARYRMAPPSSEALEQDLRIYNDAGLDVADLEAAARRHLADPDRCRYLPLPGDLLAHYVPAASGQFEVIVGRLVAALDKLRWPYYIYSPEGGRLDDRAIERDFGRPAVEAISEAGGATDLLSAERSGFALKRLRDGYRAKLDAAHRAGLVDLRLLSGLSERRGLPAAPPCPELPALDKTLERAKVPKSQRRRWLGGRRS